jgi:hypothetical protein
MAQPIFSNAKRIPPCKVFEFPFTFAKDGVQNYAFTKYIMYCTKCGNELGTNGLCFNCTVLTPELKVESDYRFLGIAGLVLFIVSLVIYVLIFVGTAIVTVKNPDALEDQGNLMFIGLFVIGALGINLIAIVMSFAGIFFQRKKVLPVLSTGFNGIITILIIVLIIVGNLTD